MLDSFSVFVESNDFEQNARALVMSIINNPKDVTTWLVYADLLEENGDNNSDLIRFFINGDYDNVDPRFNQVWSGLSEYNKEMYERSFSLGRFIYRAGVNFRFLLFTQLVQLYQLMSQTDQQLNQVEQTMMTINQIIGGAGVEGDIYHDRSCLYVNMDDPGGFTVIYDVDTKLYLICTSNEWRYDLDQLGERRYIPFIYGITHKSNRYIR